MDAKAAKMANPKVNWLGLFFWFGMCVFTYIFLG